MNIRRVEEQILCHKVKNPGSKDRALVISRGDLLYQKFIDLLNFQITKLQSRAILTPEMRNRLGTNDQVFRAK